MHRIIRLVSLGLFVAVAATGAVAQSMTGRITDAAGTGLAGITVQLGTGSPSTLTSATGAFTFTGLSNRSYTVTVLPPTSQWAAQQFTATVSGATNLGNVVLQPGAPISGVLLGPTGAPVTGANMNAYDSNGVKLFTPHDGTDPQGNFSITVPLIAIRFRAVPPTTSTLIAFETQLQVTGPVNLGTIHLQQGYAITGTVVDAVSGVPIGSVRIITKNGLTGTEIVQTTPTTGSLGQITLLLPVGSFDVTLEPPSGNAHAAKVLHGVIVLGPRSLGLVQLQRAVFVAGTVVGPGGPVTNADIDVYTTDGYKLLTPRDKTDGSGNFSVAVPAGAYVFTVQPPVATGLCGGHAGPATFSANGSIGTMNLAPGVALTLTLLGPNGPEADADIDLLDPITGEKVIQTDDHATANGVIATIVPTGSWNVAIDAAQGSLGASLRFANVPFVGPVTVTLPLPPKQLRLDLVGVGIQQIAQGGSVPATLTVQNTTTATLPIDLQVVVRYPSGAETPVFPPLPIDVPPLLDLTLGGIFFPIPVVPAGQLDRELQLLVIARVRSSQQLLDEAFVHFVVH